MFWFGTDQSDIVRYVDVTVGQHSLYEHSQVGAAVLQVRRPIGEVQPLSIQAMGGPAGCPAGGWVWGRVPRT